MQGTMDWTQWRVRSRLFGLLLVGPCLAGCAAMSQDVDLYYRQMAVNWQEALDKAKLDEVALNNQSRVLGVTGDKSKYVKAQRRLQRLKDWEDHCAKEQKRFEKAAEWMESHFHLKKPELDTKAAPGGPAEIRETLKAADSENPNDTRGHNIPETFTD